MDEATPAKNEMPAQAIIAVLNDEICDDELYSETSENNVARAVTDEFVPTYSVATFENCTDSQLGQEYADSLMRYFSSEPHLEQNIVRAEVKHLSSKSFRNSVFVHTVAVVMQVRTARLWESPASYVIKFLGQNNVWERSNGTVIKLSRIHQK